MSGSISNASLIVLIVCTQSAYCYNIPDSSVPKYIPAGSPKTSFRMFSFFKHEIKLKKLFVLTKKSLT